MSSGWIPFNDPNAPAGSIIDTRCVDGVVYRGAMGLTPQMQYVQCATEADIPRQILETPTPGSELLKEQLERGSKETPIGKMSVPFYSTNTAQPVPLPKEMTPPIDHVAYGMTQEAQKDPMGLPPNPPIPFSAPPNPIPTMGKRPAPGSDVGQHVYWSLPPDGSICMETYTNPSGETQCSKWLLPALSPAQIEHISGDLGEQVNRCNTSRPLAFPGTDGNEGLCNPTMQPAFDALTVHAGATNQSSFPWGLFVLAILLLICIVLLIYMLVK